ncbi:Bromodomain-containing protein, partial [Chytriomyces sp. MP71]
HQLKYCSQSLARLKRLKDAPPFLHPVDPVKLGIPTYFTIVTHPMDISTIQKKLDTGAYTSAHGFVDDLNLMFENCWRFNGRESLVGLMAVRLQAYMQTQLEKMPMTPPTRISSEPNGLSPNRRPPTKQALAELKYAASVTREMMKPKYYAFNFPFLEPVDHVKLNIPTYPLLIKHPMDMGTILKKLERGDCYSSGVEFEADMRLVFRNCYTFNAPGSEVHEMGRKLEQLFELKWRERP